MGTQIYLKIFSALFGEGNPNVNFKALANEAVHDFVKDNAAAKEEYNKLSQEPLTLYLTNDASDNWSFDFGHVRSHGLSRLYYEEAINFVRCFLFANYHPKLTILFSRARKPEEKSSITVGLGPVLSYIATVYCITYLTKLFTHPRAIRPKYSLTRPSESLERFVSWTELFQKSSMPTTSDLDFHSF